MIGAGRKNKLITIWQLREVTTDEGEVTEEPIEYASPWAAIEPLDAKELWFAQQSQATTSHKITLWFIPGITSRMQATWNGRTFKFGGVVNSREENRETVIDATEVIE